jgi:hypothetical protein
MKNILPLFFFLLFFTGALLVGVIGTTLEALYLWAY